MQAALSLLLDQANTWNGQQTFVGNIAFAANSAIDFSGYVYFVSPSSSYTRGLFFINDGGWVIIGDGDHTFNAQSIEVNDANKEFRVECDHTLIHGNLTLLGISGNPYPSGFFDTDIPSGLMQLGDWAGSVNSTQIEIDDVGQQIILTSKGTISLGNDPSTVSFQLVFNTGEIHHATDGPITFQPSSNPSVSIIFNSLPTSSAGLVPGQIWNNAGVLNIV